MFKSLATIISNRPVKVILFAVSLILIFAFGARNINLATGNETLIERDSKVYQDNHSLESEFGGESIIVLFEGKEIKDLLTTDNLKKMKELENALIQHDEIYSVVSPVTLVEQISKRQYDKYQTGLQEIADGLNTMGLRLDELGTKVYTDSKKQQQAQQLKQISSQISQLSQKMNTISEKSASLPTVPENSISGLEKVKTELGNQMSELNKMKQTQAEQADNLKNLGQGLTEMGGKLISISDNIETILSYSDIATPSIPSSQRTLDKMIYEDNGTLRAQFKELIIDDKYMLLIVKLDGNVDDSIKSDIAASIKDFIEDNPMDSVVAKISGKPVLDTAIRTSMKDSMRKMLGISVVFMVVVLTMTFRVRCRLLPLLTILIVVIGTVGIMGWLNIPVTMVSMAVFPILIGLGIDYAIQLQNRYVEELSMTKALTKMAPAILTALIATGLGFLALYTSPVPMIQDFGKMLTVGMIVSFIIAVLVTVPILYTRDRFFSEEKTQSSKIHNKSTIIETFLNRFTGKIVAFKSLIVLLAFTTAGFGVWADLKVGAETDIETFMPQDVQELKDIRKLRDVLGTTDQVSILYSGENVLNESSLRWIDNMTQSLPQEFPGVIIETKSITSIMRQTNDNTTPTVSELKDFISDLPESQLKLLVNKDKSKGVITVGIKHLKAENLKEFIEDLNIYISDNKSSALEVTVTGKSVLDVEMISALTTGRYKITLLGMGAVFLGLLVIYRHPVKAFIPLFPIILIVGWSGGVMYLFDLRYTPLTATLGALIIGIGTEFTILIMERFFEEKEVSNTSIEAITTSVSKIGTAIFASALTTIGGFSALLISDFEILSNFGMMTLVNICFALVSTIVVMPALLIILDGLTGAKTKKVTTNRDLG